MIYLRLLFSFDDKSSYSTQQARSITDPKKTTDVKRSLASIAKKLLNKNKDLKVTKTNL